MGVQLPLQNFFVKKIQPNPWVRPNDWPVITNTANEAQFLFPDLDDASCTIRTQFTRISGSQDIIIDWGDGNTDVITSTAQTDTTHTYIPGTGTPCSLGYTTFVIRVYFTGIGTSVLNETRIFSILVSGNTLSRRQDCPVLEVYYGDGTQTVEPTTYFASSSSFTNINSYRNLHYVKFPSTVSWTSFNSTFVNCFSLRKVDMPTSAPNLADFTSSFQSCSLLEEFIFPANANVTNLTNTFFLCNSLVSVKLPTTLTNCTTLQNTFNSCEALKNITIPNIQSCNNLSSTFSGCTALEWVKFEQLPSFGSVTFVSLSQTFQNCINLQNVYFPATCSGNANYSATSVFTGCTNLKNVVFPENFNPSTLSQCFSSCSSLVRVIFKSPMSRCTSMSATFTQCINLKEVQLPSAVSASGIDFSSAFNTCRSLEEITINSSYLFTNMLSAFASCESLKNLNWNPGVQNSITSFASTFSNCQLLESITLPTSMNSCTSLGATFQGNFSLKSITLPATMNSVTTMDQAFSSCYSLTSVTLPTSMTACTSFANVFSTCTSLRSVVLPNSISTANVNFTSIFNNCTNLTSITFPGAVQYTNVNNMQSMFQACTNLLTITNLEKMGSLGATPLVNGADNTFAKLLSVSFSCPFSRLTLNGESATEKTDVQSVRLLNTSAGQWTGSSPQINVSFTNMSTADLIQLFNDMAAQGNVVSKTINITSATGTAGLVLADRQIITTKGWTIIG